MILSSHTLSIKHVSSEPSELAVITCVQTTGRRHSEAINGTTELATPNVPKLFPVVQYRYTHIITYHPPVVSDISLG